jgi:UDP-N-acetyl-2-amino-2-deoxyglucuronate dehydrogenase
MTIHVGLIGGGNITETHARAARAIPGVEIAAIHGSNAGKVTKLCSDHGGKPYRDFAVFLKHRPMDLVLIGSPTHLHAEQGIASAEQGLHILTDKAIDISTERADALIKAAERARVKLGVIFQDRAQPEIRQLKSWIDQGLLGKILFVDARVKWWRPPEYYSDSRWRGAAYEDGGGMLINQAIHTIDLLLWLLGDVTRVQAHMATVLHKIPVEDTACVLLQFRSGVSGMLQHDRVLAANLRKAPPGINTVAAPDTNASASSPVVSDYRGHQAVLEDFLMAMKEDGTPLCDGREGRRSVALIEEIYRASRSAV